MTETRGIIPEQRKHTGCDDLCPDCCQSMEDTLRAVGPTVDRAMKAFWGVVKDEYPDYLKGEPPDYIDIYELRESAAETVRLWLFEEQNKGVSDGK